MRARHPGPSLRGAWGLGPGEASCHAYLAPALQGMAYVWICSPQRPLRSSASALCQPPHGKAASHCKLCQPLPPRSTCARSGRCTRGAGRRQALRGRVAPGPPAWAGHGVVPQRRGVQRCAWPCLVIAGPTVVIPVPPHLRLVGLFPGCNRGCACSSIYSNAMIA